MLIGYTDEMTNQQVAELGEWADYHAKNTPTQAWKRAYALIREGSDLLLRRRASAEHQPEFEPQVPKEVSSRGADLWRGSKPRYRDSDYPE